MANAVCINGQNRVCVDMRTRAFSLMKQRLRHSRNSKGAIADRPLCYALQINPQMQLGL
jgi:hypothetical protein